jgi:hypothetical protein
MRTQTITCLLLLTLLFTLAGCKKDEPIEAQIHISPEVILLNSNETGKLYISVQPPVTSNYIVTVTPSMFAIVTPSSGTLRGESVELELRINHAGLDEGVYYGIIEVITNNAGKATSEMAVAVDPKPQASVSNSNITFQDDEDEHELVITNTGTGFLNWQLESNQSWLAFEPANASLGAGQSLKVMAKVNRGGLAQVTLETEINLISNSLEAIPPLRFTLNVPATVILNFMEDQIVLGYFSDSIILMMTNTGNVASNWHISNIPDYLTFHPASGMLQAGEEVMLTVSIDRSGLQTQAYNSIVRFVDGQGYFKEVPVIAHNFKEEKWLISSSVVVAAYDRVNDVMIVCFSDPPELRKYDPEFQSVASVSLSEVPTALSVSQDGNYAAVGHAESFSYVNLTTMLVEQVYPVSATAWNIILAPNNWVYVFPTTGFWTRIHCIELATGEESLHTGNSIYHRTTVGLHPSGNYIYGVDNSKPEKYGISGGTAIYLARNFNSYAGRKIWISETGSRIFGDNRQVLRASENSSIDMEIIGSLTGSTLISSLDYSENAKRLYAVFSSGEIWNDPPGNLVRVYDTDYLALLNEFTLPGFLFPGPDGSGILLGSEGHYGFFNAAGTRFFALVKIAPRLRRSG